MSFVRNPPLAVFVRQWSIPDEHLRVCAENVDAKYVEQPDYKGCLYASAASDTSPCTVQWYDDPLVLLQDHPQALGAAQMIPTLGDNQLAFAYEVADGTKLLVRATLGNRDSQAGAVA